MHTLNPQGFRVFQSSQVLQVPVADLRAESLDSLADAAAWPRLKQGSLMELD